MLATIEGRCVWQGGKSDWIQVRKQAADCEAFSPDCEEECVDDEDVSCYNCRYRRWTRESFMCMKEARK